MIGATHATKCILVQGKSGRGIRVHLAEMSIARIDKISSSHKREQPRFLALKTLRGSKGFPYAFKASVEKLTERKVRTTAPRGGYDPFSLLLH
jgi:hypothetical protein